MSAHTATAPEALHSSRLILCEGEDEMEILEWLRDQRKLDRQHVEIRSAGGRDKLPIKLANIPAISGGYAVRLVAVVLDTEDLKPSSQTVPKNVKATASAVGLQLLLFTQPNTKTAGSLETLARTHAGITSAAGKCADAWESCIAPHTTKRTQAQKDKAWLQVWLAGSGVYNKSRLGVALTQVPKVRQQLKGLLQHFDDILDQVLAEPLS